MSKKTSKTVIDKIKSYITFENVIGFLAGTFVWFLSIEIWYGAYSLKIFGQIGVERVSGFRSIAAKMIRDVPLLFILFTVLSILFGILIARFVKKTKRIPDKRGDIITDDSERRPMTREEFDEVFDLNDPKSEIDGVIYGEDEDSGLVISLPYEPKNVNKAPTNEIVIGFGPSGTRKTSSIILPNMYQFMLADRPICVSDPKGEIYKDTIAAAQFLGYKTYILNTITNQGIHSDGVDILKPIRDASEDEAAGLIDQMVQIILDNTEDKGVKNEFWDKSAVNCLTLIITLVTRVTGFPSTINVTNPNGSVKKVKLPVNGQGEYRTFYAVSMLLNLSRTDFENLIKGIMSDKDMDKIRGPYNTWMENDQKGQVRVSLATQLSIFNSKTLCRILSEPEIDLDTLPTERAIVYLECPDGVAPYKCVLTMFTTMLFHKIESYVDTQRAGRALEHPYTIVFEEMANIGKIPNISNTLSALSRSRGVPIYMFFQNISQMMDIYSSREYPNEWEAMLDNCGVKLLLGTADTPTAEKFEKLCGNMTVIEYSKRRQRNIFTRILSNMEETQTITEREKPVYSASELLGNMFPTNKILIVPGQHNALMAEKYFSKRHMLYRLRFEAPDGGVLEMTPSMHTPKWRIKDLSDEKTKVVGSAYVPEDVQMKVKYFENYEPIDEDEDEEKPKSFKEKLEHFLFVDEDEGPKRRRVVSSHSFQDFEEPESYKLKKEDILAVNEEYQKRLSGIEEDEEEEYSEYESAVPEYEDKGTNTDKDKKASEVFDEYDW